MSISNERIERVRIYAYGLALRPSPTGPDRGGAGSSVRRGALLRLRAASGAEGWGEAAPLRGFSAESLNEVTGRLERLAVDLLGTNVPERLSALCRPEILPEAVSSLPPSARWAYDQAVWGLLADRRRIPPAALLGGRPDPAVPVNYLLGTETPEALEEEARAALSEGYRTLKLKIGDRDLETEIARTRAAAAPLEGRPALRLDANRKLDLQEAVDFAAAVRELPIAYLEEPVSGPDRFADLAARTGLPLALDETTREIAPTEIGDYGASALVLKPTLLGGLAPTEAYVRSARAHHTAAVLTSSFETGLGHRAIGWLVQGWCLTDRASGLSTYGRLEEDLLDPPLRLERGRLYGLERFEPAGEIRTEGLEPLTDTGPA